MRRLWLKRSDLKSILPALAAAESFLRPSMPPLNYAPAKRRDAGAVADVCRGTAGADGEAPERAL